MEIDPVPTPRIPNRGKGIDPLLDGRNVGVADFKRSGVQCAFEFFRRAVGHLLSFIDHSDMVAALGLVREVRGHQNGCSGVAHLEQLIPEFATGIGLHFRGRFIEQQQSGMREGRGSKCNPALLSTGKRAGEVLENRRERRLFGEIGQCPDLTYGNLGQAVIKMAGQVLYMLPVRVGQNTPRAVANTFDSAGLAAVAIDDGE